MLKTNRFDLELMQANSSNKDLIYNDNLLQLDSFMNFSITGFVKQAPASLNLGDKFIIGEGEHKNKICYKNKNQQSPALLSPTQGMIVFVQLENAFFTFNKDEWVKVAVSGADSNMQDTASSSAKNENVAIGSNSLLTGQEKFLGIEKTYTAPPDHSFLHLYVNNNVKINLDKVRTRLVTFIIKQHYQSEKKLVWPSNILWPNKTAHKLTMKANATDIVRIYRLVETNHFLGEIIGQDYQF